MSILYNRLKGIEQEKKPDIALDEGEEFPLDSEIKRQKKEHRHRARLVTMGGILVFLLAIFVVVELVFVKQDKVSSKHEEEKPTVAQVVEPAPPSPSKAEVILPQEAPDQAESQAEEPPEAPVEEVVLPDNLFEQGTELYKRKRYSEAVTAYVKGLQQEPQTVVGYNNLGVVYYQQGRLQRALTQLKLAVELNPQYADAQYNIAIVLEKLGQNKQALHHYLKFLQFVPPEQQELQKMVQAHVRFYY